MSVQKEQQSSWGS
ncbi:rCG25866 [Rattus norvegicus]|uniref:RCG25866 n=1 Tax=Rattus norvegicus TaxID=10116 RepID=A6I3U5_RAT|nr:rCG25866 [Rattus norvegicus]